MKDTVFNIIELKESDKILIAETAEILHQSFSENWPDAWPTKESALAEVKKLVSGKGITLAALDENGHALGFIGAAESYRGKVLEIHPLCVKQSARKSGVASKLVKDIEQKAKSAGVLTMYLGTDDENRQTSLSGMDLYCKTWDKIKSVENLKNHPYRFWEKLGFSIVGVVPDANGIGKPDIMMAKRVN